jgi:hypothetical protein
MGTRARKQCLLKGHIPRAEQVGEKIKHEEKLIQRAGSVGGGEEVEERQDKLR